MWGDIAIAFTIAFISTFMITPHTINLAKKLGAVDTPQDDRRMNKVMMTHFYMACAILKADNVITPSFSKQEIRDILRWPLSPLDVLKLKECRAINWILYCLGVLPPTVSICLIRIIGWMKGLL